MPLHPDRHRAPARRVRFVRLPGVALAAWLGAALPGHASDLSALSLEALLDVRIVGASKYRQKQSEVAAAVSVITRQEIKAFGWRTLDEALASLPGVHLTYDRQYTNLGTRGFGLPGDFNTRVLITINGNRVNDPIFDTGVVGREFPLDLALVERIEFVPGPGGAVYGQNAMFGVVNIVTRRGADLDGAELAVSYQRPQSQHERRASWGRSFDDGTDVLLSASALRSHGEDRFLDFGTAGVAGVAAGLDGERDNEFFARLVRGAWSFDLVHGNRHKSDPTGGYFSDPLVPGQNQQERHTSAQLQYERGFAGDTLQLSGRLFAGRHRYDSSLSYAGSWFAYPAASDWHGIELRLLSTAWVGHKLMLGIEAQDNTRVDQHIVDRAAPANALIRSPGHRVGVYVQDEWRLADTLTATAGLRVDRNSSTGSRASPRAGLIWQAAPLTSIKALYGRAYRAPNAYERDYEDGVAQLANPSLKGESVDTLEVVADHRVGRDLLLTGSVYRWAMNDLIVLGIDPASGLPQYRSGDRIDARGVELAANRTWDSGMRLRASVSSQHVSDAGGAALPNSPRWLGKLNFSAPLPAGLYLGYELRYTGERLTLDGTRLGGHVLSHLHLGATALAKRLELTLGIRNLFDKRHAHPGADTNWQNAFEQDGRSVLVGLLYRL
ncbi:MAG: TonB-dependent receptor [Burkholderiaceae bacterium]|nr:TonB-dependent receptor [Burkholderiaceae bacterium]